MILVALGANLPDQFDRPPAVVLSAAADAIDRLDGVAVTVRSRLWATAPVPVSDQPWYVNAVVRVETRRPPVELLAMLHGIEAAFGRVRTERWAPRVLDLDLLAYGDQRRADDGQGGLTLPHPRLGERAFVLLPLIDVAPEWRHPVDGQDLATLLRGLPPGQDCRPLAQMV